MFFDGQVWVEQVKRLLGKITHRQTCAETHRAGIRSDGARDDFQERGLARSVLAHHAPSFSTTNVQVQAIVNNAPAIGLPDVFECDDLIAGSRRLPKIELHDTTLLRQFDLLDLVQCLHAALDLRRFRRMSGESFDESLLFREHCLLPRVCRLAIRLADLAFSRIKVVVAGVHRYFAPIDLRNPGDDAIHEFAIV